ncbi:MAG: F0F1 ATP synthase subunit epsilon [Deltaproteobacteria bacterium]|nr:F0F1 ATP synthase subunit epsilon [Deltaproteobacteria bacterium]
MAETVKLEIVTPEKYVVSEDAQIVMAPGELGEFGILSGHTPFLTSLQIGKIRYQDTGGKEQVIFVSGGFAEALPDRITILAESAELQDDIDVERAKSALNRAEKRLSTFESNLDIGRAKAAMTRAMTRIRMSGM